MSRAVPARTERVLSSRQRVLNPGSPEFSCCGIPYVSSGITVMAWPAANDPVAVPFALSETTLVTQLGLMNGSAAGGNFDVGIYDLNWARIVSAGSTAAVTNNVVQFANTTDTVLAPGRYYYVMVRDNATANRGYGYAPNATSIMAICGLQDSTTDAFPLPDPLTNMAAAASFARLPYFQIQTRSL